jgi:cell wall-associated NlpC family hydrolase
MNYGICDQAVVPVRVQPGDQQEMSNQLLFGDLVVIKGQVKDWLLIETFDDQYEGWIDQKQISIIENDLFNQLIISERNYMVALAEEVFDEDNRKIVLTRGAFLPFYEHGVFSVKGIKFPFEKEVRCSSQAFQSDQLIKLAKSYLGSPYLWGGRSPFGIDCSGFVQVVFKMFGFYLPRDASQQVQHGESVNFIHEAMAGDLAFFGNDEGTIVHVGILVNNSQIIHASGQVRIDTIDHQGIFNKETNKYSHQLRIIKRIIN